MKSLKTIVYTLIVLVAFSCNTNEEIFEAESQLGETNLSARGLNDLTNENGYSIDPNEYHYSRVFVEYNALTTEIEKQAVRHLNGTPMGLYNWEQCLQNPNAEIWYVRSLTATEFFNDHETNLQNNDDVENNVYEGHCNQPL